MQKQPSPTLQDAAPRYRRIHDALRSLILSGRVLPGERMPTEMAISREYGVSRHTAQHVFRLLTEEGLVVRRQGSGTYAAPLGREEGDLCRSVRMRLGGIHQPDSFLVRAHFKFARRLAEITRNQIQVEVIHSAQLGSDTEQLRMVREGLLEMFGAAIDWLERVDPVYGVTNMPFLFRDMDHLKLFAESPFARQLRDRVLDRHGIRVIADNWFRLPRVLISRRPVLDLTDVEGLRLRVPSIPTYIRHWRAVGAIPVEAAFHEVKDRLENGEFDAADVPRDEIYRSGLHRAARFVTDTRHLYSRACIVIGEEKFQDLRPDLRDAILEAGAEAGREYSAMVLEMWRNDRERMIREGAVFIETDIEPFRDRTRLLAQKIFGQETDLLDLYRSIFELRQPGGNEPAPTLR